MHKLSLLLFSSIFIVSFAHGAGRGADRPGIYHAAFRALALERIAIDKAQRHQSRLAAIDARAREADRLLNLRVVGTTTSK